MAELESDCAALGWPEKGVCVKAAVGNGSRGVRLLDAKKSRYDLFFNEKPNSMYISYEELIRTLSERETIPEMLVMELLPGTEYSADFLCDHGKTLYCVCRRGEYALPGREAAAGRISPGSEGAVRHKDEPPVSGDVL